jgi:hypothetical protein
MLAKVITVTHSHPTQGFGPVLQYILRAGPEAGLSSSQELETEAGHLHLDNEPYWTPAEDAAAYADDVAAIFDSNVRLCRQRGRFRTNPVYHVAINWKEGEHPTAAQAQRTCQHVMKALGFDGCGAVWSLHRDTDNDHVHLVVNRVHPVRLTPVGVPLRDYLILDRCMRELELELGFGRAQGPYITVDTEQGPQIVRMSRTERRARGLLQDPDAPRITRGAQHAEWNLTGASFQTWVAGGPAAALHPLIQTPGVRWQEVHDTLAGFDCRIVPRGSGLVIVTTLSGGRILAAKASIMGRWAGKAALERVLGAYVVPTPGSPKVPHQVRKSYERFMAQERLQEKGPRLGSDDPERLLRRAERAEARKALAARYAMEQAQNRTQRVSQRQDLRKRHEQERCRLLAQHRDQRRQLRVGASARSDARITLSLWSFEAAAEREAMQRRHAAERRALTQESPRGEVWRGWVEGQAQAGDKPAQAALRGIRYREQRKRRREDGIEGEELGEQRPLTMAGLRAEVDSARLLVIYYKADGAEVFRDTGPRIVMRDKGEGSLEAALRVAAQKYGPRVQITGSEDFRERAARMATRLGIAVDNADLGVIVSDERRRLREPQSVPSLQTESHCPTNTRSRGPER